MHLCHEELRWLPFLLPAVPIAVAFGRRAWTCVCDVCRRIVKR